MSSAVIPQHEEQSLAWLPSASVAMVTARRRLRAVVNAQLKRPTLARPLPKRPSARAQLCMHAQGLMTFNEHTNVATTGCTAHAPLRRARRPPPSLPRYPGQRRLNLRDPSCSHISGRAADIGYPRQRIHPHRWGQLPRLFWHRRRTLLSPRRPPSCASALAAARSPPRSAYAALKSAPQSLTFRRLP